MPIIPTRLLQEALPLAAQQHPEKIAVIFGKKAYSYQDLEETTTKLAVALLDRGLRRGDRVAIYMENSWACVVSIYAVLKAGGVFVVINPQTKSGKLVFMLNDCAVRQMLTEEHLVPNFAPLLSEVTSLKHVIVSGGNAVCIQGEDTSLRIEQFDEVVGSSRGGLIDPVNIPLDLAALIYTSGSTGYPKGVMQTHQSMLFAAYSIVEYLRMDSNEVIVNVLPLSFDYGLYQLLMTILLGATLVLERAFTYQLDVLQRVQENNVTTFPGVPTIFSMLVSSHARNPLCVPSVKKITNTAAALPPQLIPLLHEVFPNALIYNMYGLTECKRVSYLEPELLERKPTSVGKPIPGTEVTILDLQGNAVAPGERGILHVRGAHVMRGYWNREKETAAMLVDGVYPGEKILRTGDWFHRDDEGYLYFDGRSDDIIKCRGEKISPIEIEYALLSIKGIVEAAVVGIADDVLGQAVRAYVVEEKGANLTLRDIKRQLAQKLEGFMIPRDIVVKDSLPISDNLKTCKKLLV